MRKLLLKTFAVFSGSHEEPQLQNCVGPGVAGVCVCVSVPVFGCVPVRVCVHIGVEMGGNGLWNKPKGLENLPSQ